MGQKTTGGKVQSLWKCVEKFYKPIVNKVYWGIVMANYPSGAGVPTAPQEGFAKPASYKGYAPGTFGVSMSKDAPEKPAISGIPKVGGEIKNPETEELIRLGKLAKKEGFNFDVDADGNVTGVDIPKEWTGDEDALRLELMQQKEETGILKELMHLSLLFTENDKEVDFLKPKIQDPAALALIEQLSKELRSLIEEVHTKPEGVKLDEIRQKLPDFENAVERARNEVARTATPAPTIPGIGSAPSSIQDPEEILKKNISDLARRFKDLQPNTNDIFLRIKDPAVAEALRNASQKIELQLETLDKTPSEDFLEKVSEGIDEYNNFIADAESFLEGASSEQEKLDLQKELTEIASEVGQVLSKAPGLEKEIPDKVDQDLFIEKTRELQDAFTALKQDTKRETFDKFILRLDNYKVIVKTIEMDIAYRVAHPAVPPKPLDVSSTWPPYIYFDKSKGKNGWFFSLNDARNPESLPGDQWGIAEANIKPVFTEYLSFMQDGDMKGRAKKVELFADLIKAKNTIIDALKNKDPEQARALAEALRKTIEEKKEIWKKHLEEEGKRNEKAQEMIAAQKRFEQQKEDLKSAQDSAEQVKAWQVTITEEEALRVANAQAKAAQSVADKSLASADSLNASALDDFDKAIARLLKLAKDIDAGYENKSKTRKGIVLRPARLKKIEGEDTRTVMTREEGEIGVNEWLEKEEVRKKTVEVQKRNKQEESSKEARSLYEKAIAKDPSTFISLYVDMRTDPATGIVTYIKNEKLRKHPYRNIIEEILIGRGIHPVGPKPQDIGTSDAELAERKRKEENDVSLSRGRLTYSPSVESYQNKKWPKDARTETQKLTEPTPTVSLSGKDLLKSKYAAGMVTPDKAPDNNGARENREIAALGRQEQQDRQQAMSKLLNTIETMRGKSKYGPLWWALGTAALTATGLYATLSQKAGEDGSPAVPSVSSPTPKMDYTNWRSYIYWMEPKKEDKEIVEDIITLKPEALVEKYVQSYVKKGDSIAAHNLLSMDNGDKIISEKYKNIPGLNDQQRGEMHKLTEYLQKVAQNMVAAANKKMEQENKPYLLGGVTREIPGGVSYLNYIENIKKAEAILKS